MPRKTTPTLTDALTEYLDVRSIHVAPASLRVETSHLTRFVGAVGPRTQVHTLEPRACEIYFRDLAGQLAPSSFNAARQKASAFVTFCRGRGWLDVDPMLMVGEQKKITRDRWRLSAAELVVLPHYTRNERDRALIELLNNTALRSCDVTALKVRHVDLNNGSLRVYVSKSKKEDTLPITSELDKALRRWLVAYQAEAGTALNPDWVSDSAP